MNLKSKFTNDGFDIEFNSIFLYTMFMKIKRLRLYLIPLFVLSILLLPGTRLPGAQEQEEKITEYVKVTNVELIVRAFRESKPVGGLKESDFILYENGKIKKITSLTEIRRKMIADSEKTGPDREESTGIKKKRRLFFLYFWVTEPDPLNPEAIDYFFNKIYRQGDYVVLAVKDYACTITKQNQVTGIIKQFKTRLIKESESAKLERDRIVRKIDDAFEDFEQKFHLYGRRGLPVAPLLTDIKNFYQTQWKEFELKRIIPKVEKLKAIAASLKAINLEKWGIVFYQHDSFPMYRPKSILRRRAGSYNYIVQLEETFNTFSHKMNKPGIYQTSIKEIQQAFIKANSTFFLFVNPLKSKNRSETKYLSMDDVYSDWEGTLRGISEATGGDAINIVYDIKSPMFQIAKKEDIFYRLTYAGDEDNEKISKIKITAKDKKLKIFHIKRIIPERPDGIKIADFSYSYPTVIFTLNQYKLLYDGNGLSGDIKVKITAVDDKGEQLSFNKEYKPGDETITVTLKLKFPKRGDYSLILEALDKQTGVTALYSRKIDVQEIPVDPGYKEPVIITSTHVKDKGIDTGNSLEAILDQSANYCEKLKKATFYFTCKEEIFDFYSIEGKKVKENVYRYDYQILMEEKGKMTENRSLIKNNHSGKKRKKKKRQKDEFVLTNFYSNYPFLLPVTLVGKENRMRHRYELLSREKINGRETFKIGVTPVNKESNTINHGVIWVDSKDGSIAKIELNPRSLKGFEKVKNRAVKKNASLKLTDIHFYEVKKSGIRFPSRTEMRLIYLAEKEDNKQKPVELEHAATIFSYRDYKFFKVDVDTYLDGTLILKKDNN